MALPDLTQKPVLKARLSAWFSRLRSTFSFASFRKAKSIWASLQFAQRCYVAATVIGLFAYFIGASGQVASRLPLILVSVALCYEFWPRFSRLWDHLLGKAAVLFFYAIIANFALAHASGLVNAVTGIPASALPYSHNFALLLVLPTWFFTVSLIVLVITQLLLPFYSLILLLLKPLGVRGQRHKQAYNYVFTTFLLRYFWMFMLLINVSVFAAKAGVINSETPLLGTIFKSASEEFFDRKKTKNQSEQPESLDADTTSLEEITRNANLFNTSQAILLAEFIFNNEADKRSRCVHPENSRVIEINDFEVLLITPRKITEEQSKQAAELGIPPLKYEFAVSACQSPAFKDALPFLQQNQTNNTQ